MNNIDKNYKIEFKPNGDVLEIGGGNNPLVNSEGVRVTRNMDIIPSPNVDVVHDTCDFPWPFKTASFDGIYSSYCIEHMPWNYAITFIKEMYRLLKHGGKAIVITANTLEQCKRVVEEGINLGTIELLFGSQEFDPPHIGSHKTGFSNEYAKEIFKRGFFDRVEVLPHPVSKTDMIIEAYKDEKKKTEVFEREYFEDGSYGYKDYRDFCTHYSTAKILLNSLPKLESVLSVGCGRGYVARILENNGVKVTGMDISRHCEMTRAVKDFIRWDATDVPWPKSMLIETSENKAQSKIDMSDKEFDITFSMNFLEHIPEDKIDDVLREMSRVSNRGMHGIHMSDCPFEETDKDIDSTHKINQPKSWWENKFKTVVPEYNVVIEHPRMLEYEEPGRQPPASISPGMGMKDRDTPDACQYKPDDGLVKINLGSFTDCFYYGWINMDILDLSNFAQLQSYDLRHHDVTTGLPFKDNEVDLVFSSHLLEHLDREQGRKLLEECHRVMKPNSVMRLSTPDTKIITDKYLNGEIMDYKYINTGVESARDDADAYYNLLLAGHKTVYDEDSLKGLLDSVGFRNVSRVSPFESRNKTIQSQTITTHQNISVVMEMEK